MKYWLHPASHPFPNAMRQPPHIVNVSPEEKLQGNQFESHPRSTTYVMLLDIKKKILVSTCGAVLNDSCFFAVGAT